MMAGYVIDRDHLTWRFVMKFKSEIITQATGSIGGVSYQHSRGGLVRLARPKPTNASSPQQKDSRSRFTLLQQHWRDELTEQERITWRNYAALSPLTGKLGDQLLVTGHNMFLRSNSLRILGGLPLLATAPTTPGKTLVGDIETRIRKATNNVRVGVVLGGNWRNQNQGRLIIQTSRFLNQARNRYSGRLRFMDFIVGNTTTPPTARLFSGSAFGQSVTSIEAGQKIVFRYTSIEEDGRVSNVQQRTELVIP